MPWSNKSRTSYSRFIPSEEVSLAKQWSFEPIGEDAQAKAQEPSVEIEQPAVYLQADLDAAVQDAFERGRQQGQAEGKQLAIKENQQKMKDFLAKQGKETVERMHSLVQTMDSTLHAIQTQMASEVLEMVCELAKKVVRQELSVNQQAILAVVKESLSMLVSDGRGAIVRLHPEDFAVVKDALGTTLNDLGCQVVSDHSVPEGGCHVEQAGALIDASLSKRWKRAVAMLGQQVPWEEDASSAAEGEDHDD